MAPLDDFSVRRIPQPLALRPSARTEFPAGTPAGRPDELMIDWGNTPQGSKATLYWPEIAAIDVVRLGHLLYAGNSLEVADRHTVRLAVTSRLSFVPIPFGAMPLLAGLFTIELAQGLRRGQAFKVVIRRVSSYRGGKLAVAQDGATAKDPRTSAWRYIVGTFQVTIPVAAAEPLLWPEENALAILKYRLARRPANDRWRPVLERFVQYVAARVDGFGGKAATIPASLLGAPFPHGDVPPRSFTGKVRELLFDGFGTFEGFVLETEAGPHKFVCHEKAIGDLALRACEARLLLTVITEPGSLRIRNFIIRG